MCDVSATSRLGLNVGCGPHYAPGWTNTDLVATDEVRPDVVTSADAPFPFPPASFKRAYVGHVLEHVAWNELPHWLDDLALVLSPGAPAMFVGPDADAAIECYRTGTVSREQVDGIIEALQPYHDGDDRWDGDRHQWNCNGPRMAKALELAGWQDIEIIAVNPGEDLPDLPGWPVVSHAPLQCAVSARAPESSR